MSRTALRVAAVAVLMFPMAGCNVGGAPVAELPAAAAADAAALEVAVAADWRWSPVHRAASGVWYAHIDQVLDAYGQPEVICCDDQGNFTVLSVYSGNWYAHQVGCDGGWLAPSRPADVDPRLAGRELYAGGRNGSVHQVTRREQPAARFVLESREIGHVAGEEFHAIVAADLLPGGGDELLLFGITGATYRVVAVGDAGGFELRKVAQLPGRVRDVAVLPGAAGEAATMLGVSRSGHLLRMQLGSEGLSFETVLREDCGLGRIAVARTAGTVYVTRDDGVLLRVSPLGERPVARRIYAGGQGLRGVAAGHFFADGREAVAVYGYDRRVHLLGRVEDRFEVETIFEAPQRGHWLTTGELDGRNGTDELVAAGFDGEVVLLARPPGYALQGVAVPEEERTAPVSGDS